MTDTSYTSRTINEDGTVDERTFTGPTLTLDKLAEATAPEAVTSGDPVLDLLMALEIGDVITVTKDHTKRTVTVTSIMDADTSPYILAADHLGPIGFDRATISHGIVEFSK